MPVPTILLHFLFSCAAPAARAARHLRTHIILFSLLCRADLRCRSKVGPARLSSTCGGAAHVKELADSGNKRTKPCPLTSPRSSEEL
ncbi:hypothetical protein B0H17DRAFT_1032096 [Mycena rosella]|uniref:Secreted protein n=1 Tax=Mycena rosella TaxID=1033263 RepID=A0AAD7GYR0_MYCRO|nr:hypothetical protein B0H17DRAFT_1032096 [Mycena rosella]